MTQQIVNTGSSANAKNGDPLRDAFIKINANFTELYGNLQTVIPTATGNNGKVLGSNGTSIVWTTPVSDISQLSDNSNLLGSTNVVVAVGSTAPVSPEVGRLWYDTNSGRMYIFYDSSWVDTNPR